MAIPISYAIRNLRLRKGLTAMTALGIALTVATAVFIMALLAGLDRAFGTTGDPKNVLVLRKGSTSGAFRRRGESRRVADFQRNCRESRRTTRTRRWFRAKTFW